MCNNKRKPINSNFIRPVNIFVWTIFIDHTRPAGRYMSTKSRRTLTMSEQNKNIYIYIQGTEKCLPLSFYLFIYVRYILGTPEATEEKKSMPKWTAKESDRDTEWARERMEHYSTQLPLGRFVRTFAQYYTRQVLVVVANEHQRNDETATPRRQQRRWLQFSGLHGTDWNLACLIHT